MQEETKKLVSIFEEYKKLNIREALEHLKNKFGIEQDLPWIFSRVGSLRKKGILIKCPEAWTFEIAGAA